VARGAAIYSAALDDPDKYEQFTLVSSHALGTAFAAGARKGFKPIIKRNSTLIAKGEERFTPAKPGASSLNVEIIEGEEGYPADSDRAFPLSRLEVRLPKPERIPDDNAVLIHFRYDISGILHVRVTHERTGQVLIENEIDSFGKDGTPLQQGLDSELERLLSYIEIPFPNAPQSEPTLRPEKTETSGLGEQPSAATILPPTAGNLDDAVTVNGVPQSRL
jgi:molecular chaperone DnaK (HSP70)